MPGKNFLNQSASLIAILVATILFGLKFLAWQFTNSSSIQASFFDSLFDVFVSSINYIALKHSIKPPNKYYKWGHGKVEAIASLLQSFIIGGLASWLIYDTIVKFKNPTVIDDSWFGVKIMLFALVCTILLVVWQSYVIKKTNSLIIRADSLHYKTDFLSNTSVLISITMSAYFNFIYLDILVGLMIAAYIFISTLSIFLHALNILMDRELDDITREVITQIALSHQGVIGIDDLRTRSSGQRKFAQMHLILDPEIKLAEAYKIAYEVSRQIEMSIEDLEVIVHQNISTNY